MAPVRTSKSFKTSTSEASTSKHNAGKRRPKHRTHEGADNSDKTPGVQKIKASLRQTRRLLAKDKLAADVRVNTERRLKALEAQLQEAETARKERTIAQRYHKIKFFERQKVTRKLKQVKRQLDECTEKKEKKKLEKSLKELRVDLNYILNYPKLKKYISLFPPEVRQGVKDDDESAKGKDVATEEESSGTAAQREEIRQDIRERMDRGELSAEPELEEHRIREGKARPADSTLSASKASQQLHDSGPKRVPKVADDDFFGEESGEDAAGGDEDSDEDNMDES